MSAIAAKDWREFVRDKRLVVLAIIVALLSLVAIATSATRISAYEADRAATNSRDRETWEAQGERNPHSVAHFANWAFRPLTPMALLDPGVTPYAGSAIWMEAHNQNPARARAVEDNASAFDLGTFSAAWIFQTILPLLIFVIAAGAVARERERGTLRLMLASGASAGRIVPAKAKSVGRISALLALPLLGVSVIAAAFAGGVDPLRLLLWSLAYMLFFAIVAIIGVAVSARSQTTSKAMLGLIGIWLMAVIVVPRAGAGLAELVAPTPSADAFWTELEADKRKQFDPFDREDEFVARMTKRYGVASKEELPVSLGGLQLDASESYGNEVYDKHFGALAMRYGEQRQVLRFANLLSPLPALQNVSMALAGTDTAHQLDFQRQAETQRRAIIGQLNGDMIENGKGSEFDYKARADLWKDVPDFQYRPLSLAQMVRSVLPDLAILALWLAAAILLLRSATKRLERELA